jgi:hypothetical protein
VKNSILLVLAIFVLALASGGEYANNLLEQKIEAKANQEEKETAPVNAEISFDIFNSVIHVSQLVFHSDLIFEFSLPEIAETKAHNVFVTATNFTKYYKTLFHFIISPNAP